MTPVSAEAVASLHSLIKRDANILDETSKQRIQRHIQKLTNATQLSFAERALLQEQNRFLAEINNEATADKEKPRRSKITQRKSPEEAGALESEVKVAQISKARVEVEIAPEPWRAPVARMW